MPELDFCGGREAAAYKRPPNEISSPAAVALRLKLEEIGTQLSPKGLESAFQTAKQKQVDATMTIATRQFFAERKRIVEFAAKHRLPAIYFQKDFVDEGGLMSYAADSMTCSARPLIM